MISYIIGNTAGWVSENLMPGNLKAGQNCIIVERGVKNRAVCRPGYVCILER